MTMETSLPIIRVALALVALAHALARPRTDVRVDTRPSSPSACEPHEIGPHRVNRRRTTWVPDGLPIAATLGLSVDTVKSQVKNILSKLGADDRTQAAMIAVKRGIIEL
jgi:hypothetical protein